MLNKNYSNTKEKRHAGSVFMMLGLVFLFVGSGAALGIADNYLFFVVAIICNFVDMALKKKTKIKLSSFLLFSLLIIIFTIFYFIIGNYDRGTALSLLLYAVLMISVLMNDYNISDAKMIINGAIISSVIFSLLIVFFGHEFLYTGTAKYTYTQSFGSKITFEPNYVGTLLTLGFCLAIYCAINSVSNRRKTSFYILSVLVVLVGIFLTGSRSALVSLFLFSIIIIAFMKPSKLKRRLIIFVILLIVLTSILIITNVIPSNVYMRLLRTSYVDNSNLKRIADWNYGIKAIFDSPIIGNGSRLTLDIMMDKYGFHGDVHNTFLTFGVMYGIPVLLILVYAIIKLCYRLYKYNDRILLAVFIAMVFEWNILACQLCVSTWVAIIIMLIFVKTGKEQIEQENSDN